MLMCRTHTESLASRWGHFLLLLNIVSSTHGKGVSGKSGPHCFRIGKILTSMKDTTGVPTEEFSTNYSGAQMGKRKD